MEEIEIRKGAGGKTAYIAGTRTRVSDIARLFPIMEEQLVIDRICESLPHLDPSQVRAAVEWWRQHETEIDKEIEEERELLENVSAQ